MISLLIIILSIVGITLTGLLPANSNNVLVEQTYIYQDAPAFLVGKKIIHLTDIHNHLPMYGEDNLVTMIEEENPDYLFLTGDIVDRLTTDMENYDWLFDLIATIPTFMVPGNHEINLNYHHYQQFLYRYDLAGGVVLNNTPVTIAENIFLIGVPDPSALFNGADADAYQKIIDHRFLPVTDEDFVMVLSHRPTYFTNLARAGADLVFSGHTHGGQINLGFASRMLFSLLNRGKKFYAGGLFYYQDTVMINSRGLGQNPALFRYNVNNEYWVVTFAA